MVNCKMHEKKEKKMINFRCTLIENMSILVQRQVEKETDLKCIPISYFVFIYFVFFFRFVYLNDIYEFFYTYLCILWCTISKIKMKTLVQLSSHIIYIWFQYYVNIKLYFIEKNIKENRIKPMRRKKNTNTRF